MMTEELTRLEIVFFQNNYIKTSKYTVWTFLPYNLLEQFQRIANFYFLILLLLQLIPAISSLTPVTTAIPLIGVLALTAIKDAYDDIVSFDIIHQSFRKYIRSFAPFIPHSLPPSFSQSRIIGVYTCTCVVIYSDPDRLTD